MQAIRGPRRKLLTFACSSTATSIALALAGWLTGMRQVMHGALLALAIVAFFPFVLVAAGLMIGLGASLLVILLSIFAGGDPGPLPDGWGPLLREVPGSFHVTTGSGHVVVIPASGAFSSAASRGACCSVG